MAEKLARRGAIPRAMVGTLRHMNGMRNILAHGYGRVDDAPVFEAVRDHPADSGTFRREALAVSRGL